MLLAKDVLVRALERLNKVSSASELCTVLESEWIVSEEELRNVVANSALWAGLRLPATLKLEIEAIMREESQPRLSITTVIDNVPKAGGESPRTE